MIGQILKQKKTFSKLLSDSLVMPHLSQLLFLLCGVWNSSETFRDVPERHVNELRLQNQVELVGLLSDSLDLILRQLHQAIHESFESGVSLGAPLQPQLENVIVPAALNDLVACIVADIVKLVSHEKILG